MKNLKQFEEYIIELSREVIDSAASKMASLGQDQRAFNLKSKYTDKMFDDYIGVPFMETQIRKIFINGDILGIKTQTGNVINYGISNDNFDHLKEMSRKDFQTLLKIIKEVNPDTKYKVNHPDIKILGY